MVKKRGSLLITCWGICVFFEMNVPFVTGSEELDAEFVKKAAEAGLVSLKGHRTVGGMRASIYNAMPIEGVEALVKFMKEFEENH